MFQGQISPRWNKGRLGKGVETSFLLGNTFVLLLDGELWKQWGLGKESHFGSPFDMTHLLCVLWLPSLTCFIAIILAEFSALRFVYSSQAHCSPE